MDDARTLRKIAVKALALSVALIALSLVLPAKYLIVKTPSHINSLAVSSLPDQPSASKSAHLIQVGPNLIRGVRINVGRSAEIEITAAGNLPQRFAVHSVKRSLIYQKIKRKTYRQSDPSDLTKTVINLSDDQFSSGKTFWHPSNVLFCFLFSLLAVCSFEGLRNVLKASNSKLAWAFVLLLLGAITFLASVLKEDHGPDETMHYISYFWYTFHVRPPLLFTDDTFFRQGLWQSNYVYATGSDLSYLLTARLGEFLSYPFRSLTVVDLRLAQLLLFISGGLLLGVFFTPMYVLSYFFVLALVPQVAYLATYLNGDLLSFSMSFIAAVIVISKRTRERFLPLLLAAFLLLNSKSNYLSLCPILAVIWITSLWPKLGKKHLGYVAALIALVPLISYRRTINWIDQKLAGLSYPQDLLNHTEQALAVSQPGTPIFFALEYVKSCYERAIVGYPAWDFSVLTNSTWYTDSLHSFFGVFGNMAYDVPLVCILISAAGLLYLLGQVALESVGKAFILIITAALVLVTSLYYSISVGYQPQGRYLFPFLCLAAVFFAPTIRNKSWLVPIFTVNALVALGLFYSSLA